MASERGLQFRTGVNKVGWEESDFPILCETCLGDNPYIRMLPVEVRDKFLAEQAVQIPDQLANRDYYQNQANRNIDQLQLPYSNQSNILLEKVARLKPYYERNQAQVCSFWVKGTCQRGELCPYAHQKRVNIDDDDPKNNQQLVDRFYGRNDPLAEKILKKINVYKENDLQPPQDTTIYSLYISNITESISQENIYQIFIKFGPIESVKMIPQKKCAFVNFCSRKAAEEAIKDLYGKLIINNQQLNLAWSKSHLHNQNNQIKPPSQKPPQENKTQEKLDKFLGGLINYSDDENDNINQNKNDNNTEQLNYKYYE
ncbi:RNA binding motif protein 22, putative [Ichthyophthirius multifiliis]|uniref:RNA binding motif protein 22, putative n=1 Tax=Ichthyophthirius multifiliis TaxID=5932 RepID=G0R2V6_ICHMU|nr:RNA binding motif protein 22, putative [Ichthyophthirius multifiliis]EGR28228.1 RNA binding motif protein 22, putative [Ichthyophthirius multifiliis]|eukprot:XP_004027573.1 RNA binding motif protein 22, putative [Ichthyophthirius multifiliis]